MLLLLLLSLLSCVSSLPPPRTSFFLNSTERPLVQFSLPDVHNTTTLLLSNDSTTLYVGARDTVLSLNISHNDAITLKRKVDWSPSEAEINSCEHKGKDPAVDCPNFVSVLQLINSTHLYVCGSYAFSPHDAYIDTENFNMVQNGDAKGRCPFSPFQRNTAITIDGELFTTTTIDFRGVKPQISRYFSKHNRPDVTQDSSVSLLDEPIFVSSTFDAEERKLYFFFSEVGKEFNFVDELQIARVAQVCKDDVGGQRTLQKKWTSFAKAPLLCHSPKQLPFNVLQDMFTLQPPQGVSASETMFYGVFTSQWSTAPESAVCAFKLQDIRAAFAGSYRTFDMKTHQWSPQLGNHPYLGTCGLDNATDTYLGEVKKSFLTSTGIEPVTKGLTVVSSGKQYSRVAVMRAEAANGKLYTILFLLTESGFLHKVALFDQGARIIEEIQVFTQPELVKSMVISSTKGVLYVGTSEGVTAVPVAKCSIYKTCSQCVLARDPLCGWSPTTGGCTRLDNSPNGMVQDLENGNVNEVCQGHTRTNPVTEISVHLNEAVRLQCLKPSNLATLIWTSPNFKTLSEDTFIQSPDGSLRFLATATTFTTYRCEAEEGGYKEVVAIYSVKTVASPRSLSPSPGENHVTSKDKPYEAIPTEAPHIPKTPQAPVEKDEKISFKDETTSNTKDSTLKNNFKDSRLNITVTSTRIDIQTREGVVTSVCEAKTYHAELVVVSLLLVACICVLVFAGLHILRRRKTERKMDPLVSPNMGPELKVVE